MRVHGTPTDHKPFGDLSVAQAPSDKLQNRQLTRCQLAVGHRRDSRRIGCNGLVRGQQLPLAARRR